MIVNKSQFPTDEVKALYNFVHRKLKRTYKGKWVRKIIIGAPILKDDRTYSMQWDKGTCEIRIGKADRNGLYAYASLSQGYECRQCPWSELLVMLITWAAYSSISTYQGKIHSRTDHEEIANRIAYYYCVSTVPISEIEAKINE